MHRGLVRQAAVQIWLGGITGDGRRRVTPSGILAKCIKGRIIVRPFWFGCGCRVGCQAVYDCNPFCYGCWVGYAKMLDIFLGVGFGGAGILGARDPANLAELLEIGSQSLGIMTAMLAFRCLCCGQCKMVGAISLVYLA